GINSFDNAQIQPRTCAEADAKALHDLFRDERHAGAPADSVRLLIGADATREKVLTAIDWLIAMYGQADTALFGDFERCVKLNRTGRQVGFLVKYSTIKNLSESAIACDLIQDRLKKLTSRQFAAFVDVRVNGYTPPVGEDEPNLAEVVRSLLGESDQGDP